MHIVNLTVHKTDSDHKLARDYVDCDRAWRFCATAAIAIPLVYVFWHIGVDTLIESNSLGFIFTVVFTVAFAVFGVSHHQLSCKAERILKQRHHNELEEAVRYSPSPLRHSLAVSRAFNELIDALLAPEPAPAPRRAFIEVTDLELAA